MLKAHSHVWGNFGNWNFFKNNEKSFYLISKALFILKTFCLDFLVTQKNVLIRKIGLISKFMKQPGSQTIALHILINISRSKGNQTIKFGQLIECIMRNNFLKNHTRNVLGKLFLFLKTKIKHIICFKFYAVCFYCMPSWGISKYIEAKVQATCFYVV